MIPSKIRRSWQREGIHMFMDTDIEALLMGERVSYLAKQDLDALCELVFGIAAPDVPGYQPQRLPR